MTSRRELRRQRDDAKARATALIMQRNEAVQTAAGAVFNQKRLARQLSELRDQAVARPLPVVEPVDPPSETWIEERTALRRQVSDLTRRLDLATILATGLSDRCTALQDANDAMCRDRVTSTGNLATKGATA